MGNLGEQTGRTWDKIPEVPGLNLLRSVILSPFVGEEDSFDGMKCACWKHLSFRDELRLQDEVIKHRSFISSRLAGDLC